MHVYYVLIVTPSLLGGMWENLYKGFLVSSPYSEKHEQSLEYRFPKETMSILLLKCNLRLINIVVSETKWTTGNTDLHHPLGGDALDTTLTVLMQ